RYQFTWPDKKKSLLLANAPIAKTLRPCREESVDFDNTENLYIEGDNLDVLKLLQETYLGKIKMIYIDPPYNTGNDFVYEDDFSQNTESYLTNSGQYDEAGNRLVQNNESNGRFHTDWLNMMYPRLKLAKDLLTDDGVILINMDENEFVNLQKLCIDIFGECNDLGTIVWDKRNPKGDAKGISYQHEYILVYAKDKVAFLDNCKMQRPKKNAETILKKAEQIFRKINLSFSFDQASNEFAEWLNSQSDFSGGEKAYNKFDEKGKVFQSVSMAWPNKKRAPDDYFIPLIHPITQKPCPVPNRGWRNPSSTMKKLLSKGLILFGEDENTQPRRKYLLSENMYENIPSLLYYGGSDTVMLDEMGIPFDTPKVVDICFEHIKSFTCAEDIFLDFFSGSATTAHAIMKLNAEDEGKRKFIMVQLPELTYDGKKEKYKDAKGEEKERYVIDSTTGFPV
ncbi:MAG: site-specific DNA-methyltransferase, partial [Erysipelotrichia bacterium]|nr:site-specific DNA-methyltransferase [Erysipelotrichia bacterium]